MEFVIDVVVALATGALLWALLPRGVVLTRRPIDFPNGVDEMYLLRRGDVRVTNDSAMPVQILSVMFRSAQHPDRRSLDLVGAEDFGPWLDLEDEIDSITKSEQGLRWDQVVVPPGDSLIARVPGNSDLRITYRRAGFWGFAERRVISIHGSV